LELREGYGPVFVPDALDRKYPNAAAEWPWQWVFPASRRSIDPRSGVERRHHQDESCLQKAIRQAARAANIRKPVGAHTLRHSFATELLTCGYDIRTIQKLLGRKSVETTMIDTHVLNSAPGVRSPLEALANLFRNDLPCIGGQASDRGRWRRLLEWQPFLE
jgi:integrase